MASKTVALFVVVILIFSLFAFVYFNDVSTNSPIGWGQLYAFPANCSPGTYVIGVGGVLSCGPNVSQTTIVGTTAGTAICSMNFQGTTLKQAICYLNGYQNAGTTPQTYTYPTAFTYPPLLTLMSGLSGFSTTTTTLSFPTAMVSPQTGWVIVWGY